MTTPLPDAPRWQGYTHAQLFAMAHGGAGPSAAQLAEQRWRSAWSTIQQVEARLAQAVADAGGGWEGPAAGATASGVTPLGTWALDGAERARAVAGALAAQAEHAGHVVREMPGPPATAAPGPAAAMADWSAAERLGDEQRQRAVEVMERYTTNSAAVLPAFDAGPPPPAVVLRPAPAGPGIPTGGGATRPGDPAAPVAAATLGSLPAGSLPPGSPPAGSPPAGPPPGGPVPAGAVPAGGGAPVPLVGGPLARAAGSADVAGRSAAGRVATGAPAARPQLGVGASRVPDHRDELSPAPHRATRSGPDAQPAARGPSGSPFPTVGGTTRSAGPSGGSRSDRRQPADAPPGYLPLGPSAGRGRRRAHRRPDYLIDPDVFADDRRFTPPVIVPDQAGAQP